MKTCPEGPPCYPGPRGVPGNVTDTKIDGTQCEICGEIPLCKECLGVCRLLARNCGGVSIWCCIGCLLDLNKESEVTEEEEGI